MPTIDMICLANSRKRQGKCIAGLRLDGGGWVRPVSPGPDGSLYHAHLRLQDGTEPQPMDVIRVGLQGPQPKPHQPENWLLDGTRWELLARPLPPEAVPVVRAGTVRGPALFGDRFDRIADRFLVSPAAASLALVAPENLRWRIKLTQNFTKQTRAVFGLGGALYDLPVTDPAWEQRLKHLSEGLHEFAASGVAPTASVLTVSLSEPFNGDCYKLVAGIIIL